jgi:AraC-like DNA-binding protein
MPLSRAMLICDAPTTDQAGVVVIGRPSTVLAPFVELFWHDERYRMLTHRERVLPAGALTVVFELDSGIGIVNGLRSTCIEFETRPVGTVIGILFRPGGGRAFFSGSSHDLYNRSVALERLWGRSANETCHCLRTGRHPSARFLVLEQVLRSRMRADAMLHPAVECGLREFRRVPHVYQVLEVVKHTGLSRRRFSQLFREQVGTTPKRYCRLRRFTWVIEQLSAGKGVDWADVAQAGGYSDQSHLVHDFQEFSGLSPTVFLASERPSGAHVRVS